MSGIHSSEFPVSLQFLLVYETKAFPRSSQLGVLSVVGTSDAPSASGVTQMTQTEERLMADRK